MRRSAARFSGVLLPVVLATLVSHAPGAIAATHLCTPQQVATFTNRVHVLCTAAAAGGINYFAVCTDGNSAYSAKVLSEFTAAKIAGKRLLIYYSAADTSGTACSCAASDCRLVTGVELVD